MAVDTARATRWDDWARWSPLTAIGTVILWAAGVFTIEAADNSPDSGTAAEALAFFQGDELNIYLGSMFLMAGSLLLIWFVSTLRARIDGGAPSRLGSVVFGSGLGAALFAMSLPAAQIGGAFAGEDGDAELEPAAAQALYFATDGFFVATMYAASLLVLATSIAVLSRRLALPRWLGWASILLGVWLLIAPIGWIALIFVLPVWLVAVGVLLYLRGDRPAAAAEPAYEPAP